MEWINQINTMTEEWFAHGLISFMVTLIVSVIVMGLLIKIKNKYFKSMVKYKKIDPTMARFLTRLISGFIYTDYFNFFVVYIF